MSDMKLHRYDASHLRDFRAPITVNPAAIVEAEAPPPPPPPVFRESDLENAREAGKKIGYAEGFEAGIAQSNTEAHHAARDLAHHMARIDEHVQVLMGQYQALVSQQSTELSELVLLIARKVAGDALDTNAPQAVLGLVNRCLPVIYGKPRIAIDLAPDMVAAVEPALRRQLEQSGFDGSIEFRAVEGMAASDVRMDWGNGAAQRNTAAIWKEIEALLQQVPLSPTLPANVQPQTDEPHIEPGDIHG